MGKYIDFGRSSSRKEVKLVSVLLLASLSLQPRHHFALLPPSTPHQQLSIDDNRIRIQEELTVFTATSEKMGKGKGVGELGLK